MKLIPILLGFMSFAAAAQTTSINTTESNLSTSFLEKIKPDRISHFSVVSGPAVDGSANPKNFDGTVNTDGTSSWHQVSFGYNLNKKTRFVINPRFVIERSATTGDTAVGKLDNPVIGITTTWYKNGNFTFAGGLNTILATVSESGIARGTEWNPGGFQSANYKVNDKLNVGTWLWGRYEFHRNAPDRRRAPFFVSPYISYSVADKLTLQAFYQADGRISNADTATWDNNEQMNFSFSYQISKGLTIQPILTVYRETDFDAGQGNLNLWVSGRFL
jgi:hypothetical protein